MDTDKNKKKGTKKKGMRKAAKKILPFVESDEYAFGGVTVKTLKRQKMEEEKNIASHLGGSGDEGNIDQTVFGGVAKGEIAENGQSNKKKKVERSSKKKGKGNGNVGVDEETKQTPQVYPGQNKEDGTPAGEKESPLDPVQLSRQYNNTDNESDEK